MSAPNGCAPEKLTTTEVAKRLGHRNRATTRAWLARYRVQAIGRVTGSGEKIYDSRDIETALKRMPIGPVGIRYHPDNHPEPPEK